MLRNCITYTVTVKKKQPAIPINFMLKSEAWALTGVTEHHVFISA